MYNIMDINLYSQLTACVGLTVNVVTSVLLETLGFVYARAVMEQTASVALTASAPKKLQNAVSLDLANVVRAVMVMNVTIFVY